MDPKPEDLFKDIKAIKEALDKLSKRAVPATAEQLGELAKRPIQLDSKEFAALVMNDLAEQLPSTEAIQAAAQSSVNRITESGTATAARIERAGSAAASEIKWAARSKADVVANRIGFTSWQAALLIGLIPLLSGGTLVYLRWENERQQTELVGWKSFGLWVSEKYPEVRKVYDKSHP